MPRHPKRTPSTLPAAPVAFDPAAELDWSAPDLDRRLLREHLDESHDSASRRPRLVDSHVHRLRTLLPAPPARILDAGCGPGLYALRLAGLGHHVLGVDVSSAALAHARRSAARRRLDGSAKFRRADLGALELAPGAFDAAVMTYFVLESFPRARQAAVLRRIRKGLVPDGTLIVELRLRPDQPPGRTDWWDVVERSLLSDRPHLLLGDAVYDVRRHTYVLREAGVFDDGSVRVVQTSGWLCPYDSIPALFARAGLAITAIFDGWTAQRGTALSETVLVVARPARSSRGDLTSRYHGRPRRRAPELPL